MWSLMNKEYVAESRQRLADEAVQVDTDGLIEQLIQMVMASTPSLHHLLAIVKSSDILQDFRVLVHEFLPEQELRIMGEKDDDKKVSLYTHYFSLKYFELDEVDEMIQMLYRIPVSAHGLDEETYQEFTDVSSPHFNKTKALLSYLVEYPWKFGSHNGEGHREALYDFILKEQLASQTDLDHVPKDGWTQRNIAKALKDTPYEEMCAFAAWLHHDTGTWVLDCSSEDDMEPAEWTMDNVGYITEVWKSAMAIEARIGKLEEWMQKDMSGNFGRLVDAIRAKQGRKRVKARKRPQVEQKNLFDVLTEDRENQISEAAIAMESLGEV